MGNITSSCAGSCTPVGNYELCGCANGVPYVQLISIANGTATTIWVNTETGTHTNVKPTGFLTGTCQDVAATSINIVDVTTAPAATGNAVGPRFERNTAGEVWFIDSTGIAVQLEKQDTPFKELNRFYVDPNGADTNNGANEAPFLTVQAAVAALAQGDIAIVNEGVYTGAVTLSVQNTAISGADGSVNSMTQIASLVVSTASGTSNKVSDLTVLGDVEHTGGAPLYMHSVTVSGDYASSSTAYEEINDCRIQDGVITKMTTGTLYIKDSLIGDATFTTPGSVISLDNVSIDADNVLTIGAGVVYMLNDVRGGITIDPAAIPLETAALGAGATAFVAKSAETATFNDVRLTNVPTVTGRTKALVRDANGFVSEQEFPSGIPTGGTDGQVLTVQADGSYAWESLPGDTPSGGNVFFDGSDPTTATIFDVVSPPVTDDPALHEDSTKTYWGADGSVWVWNGTAYVTKTYSFPTPQLDPDITATASQTAFTLLKTPIGKVWMYRNGIRLSANAITVVGTAVTYLSAGNGGKTLDAGDRIEFEYSAY